MTTQATSEITAEPTTAAPARPKAPSVHMRALITWLAIFPLVSLGMMLLGPIMEPWHPVLRALVLTAFVVPTAVYFVVPRLFAGHGALSRKAVERAAQRAARKSA
ncbi:hypothetical protein SAMN04487917_105113 [Arthrobacter sp. yr096]|uniref:hypothetical protein n=1 Tax=unclassified Arthrobacter TaxID=235627 RepID=UPI0008996CB6|nr:MULTISPECIES: hypothetical protein [unclassified Arthrobacter]SDW69234.1 hypothetical protein SAMN04487912_104110 [Arthrobacter sp. cf158]SEJ34742.1 hypothetical protein SAMN04487917_105113 [Arthrobacter sp. yr096]